MGQSPVECKEILNKDPPICPTWLAGWLAFISPLLALRCLWLTLRSLWLAIRAPWLALRLLGWPSDPPYLALKTFGLAFRPIWLAFRPSS